LVARRAVLVLVATALATAPAACGGESDPAGVIDRETFIATWVDLRTAALRTGDPLPEGERTRVLQERGVTEDELLGFAEAHGDDPRFMAEVWTEIENRMRPAPADSVAQP
jgi:hypothetical protein